MSMKLKKIAMTPINQSAEPSTQRKPNEYEAFVVIPPDGGWGWVVVFGAFFSYFLSDGLQYSFGIFLKDISEAFKCGESKISLAGAINTCLFCISGPFSAALINRFGYRIVSFSGSVLAAASCLLTSFSNNIYMVIVFYGVLGGIGFGMIYLTAVIVVGFYFERWRALATGIAVCGAGFGGICLPPLFTLLLVKIGWRHTFQVLSGMSLCIIIFSSVFRPIKPTKVLITTEPTTEKLANQTRGTGYNKLIDGKISTVTIVEPTRMRMHSSELLVGSVFATNSGETSGRADERKNGKEKECRCACKCSCRRKEEVPTVSPLRKDDIFYSGSLMNLPEYKKSSQSSKLESKSRSNLEYQLSITRDSPQGSSATNKRGCCTIMFRTLVKMLDCTLLRSQKFVLLIFNCIFMSLGFYTPFIFIKNAAVLRGIDGNVAYWFISTMGLANIFGRVICGLVSTIPGVRAIILVYCLLFIAGVSTILSTLCYRMWVLFFYSAVYGFTIASMSALKTVIIVDMLGLDNLTNAIGMILMFQGMATLVGISVSGYLKEVTGDYHWSFYFGGICICIAALLLFFMNMLEYRSH